MALGPQFVYVAAYEGGIVADNAIGERKRKVDLSIYAATLAVKFGLTVED